MAVRPASCRFNNIEYALKDFCVKDSHTSSHRHPTHSQEPEMTEPEASVPAVMRNYHEVLRNDLARLLTPLAEVAT